MLSSQACLQQPRSWSVQKSAAVAGFVLLTGAMHGNALSSFRAPHGNALSDSRQAPGCRKRRHQPGWQGGPRPTPGCRKRRHQHGGQGRQGTIKSNRHQATQQQQLIAAGTRSSSRYFSMPCNIESRPKSLLRFSIAS